MLNNQEMFEANLAFFEEVQPALYELLRAYEPLGEVIEDDGDVDILFDGTRLYNTGAQAYVENQLRNFWAQPERTNIQPISSDNVDAEGQEVLFNVLKYAEKQEITFSTHRVIDQTYHLLILGVGLGLHIQELLDRAKPRNVVIVEPNLEFLYQSLKTFDWVKFGSYFRESGAYFHFIIDGNVTHATQEMRSLFRSYGPVSFDGLTVYRHYENPFNSAVVKYIVEHGDMTYSGLGFFEDELNMIANTHKNLRTGQERMFFANLSPKDFPVFVVGSGPSLDSSMDVIRENQHKAIVISCGTALAPLLRGGVTPDFHVELERGELQAKIPSLVSGDFDLSKICLVASSTVVEEVKAVFSNRVYFMRHMLSSYPIFSGNSRNCLRNPSPMVGNAGCSFAQDTGFREFYLFGMDLGFRDEAAHHSDTAAYWDLNGRDFRMLWDRFAPGNFGGRIMSSYVFQWSRDSLEASMQASSQGYQYYNCSDGTRIKGALPLLPEFVSLSEPSAPKAEFIEKLINGFPVYTQDVFRQHWVDGVLRQQIRDLGESLVNAIEDNPDLSSKKYVSTLTRMVDPSGYDDSAKMVLRGSLYHLLIISEYYLDRVIDSEKREMFSNYLREQLIKGIQDMCRIADVEFTHLEEHGTLKDKAS
ncbi:6-hydroxymethylpterin diphosphokinase MptE-like protein [Magnetovibrio sp. PR-2]|uniref:motility associated factor glycosyltransferase family protein n=1 Tax=Magnetovibrio sp. PR-2 TaxID=3120356 RepID=UPI002FCE43CD